MTSPDAKSGRGVSYVLGFLPTYVESEIREIAGRGWRVRVHMQSGSPLWESITGAGLPDGVERGCDACASWLHLPSSALPVVATARLGAFAARSPRSFFTEAARASAARSFRRFLCGAELAARLWTDPPARIHSHFAWENSHTAMWAARLLRVPFSMTVHAADIFVPRNPGEVGMLIEAASPPVTISAFNRDYIGRHWGPAAGARTFSVHLGVDQARLPPAAPDRSSRVVFCTASGLAEKKGISVLLEACEILSGKRSGWSCSVTGGDASGEVLSRYRSLVARRGLSRFVELPGAMPSAELLDRMSSASLFVLPCIQAPGGDMDGIPVSLMEAMGMGLPCISSRISGIPELIEDGVSGILVEPGSAAALAAAMERLLDDDDLAGRLGRGALRRIASRFSIRGSVDGLLTAWDSPPATGGDPEGL